MSSRWHAISENASKGARDEQELVNRQAKYEIFQSKAAMVRIPLEARLIGVSTDYAL